MNPQVINFFKEIYFRLRTKSPKLFSILQIFGGSLMLLGYLPGILDDYFNVHLSDALIHLCNKIAWIATGFTGAAMIPAEAKTTSLEDGTITKEASKTKFPFTASVEQKKADKGSDK